jgi:hypothetical protein
MTEPAPSPERRQHDRITRADETLPDADGAIGLPWYAESMLARMERRGDITAAQRRAGEEFARLFWLAHLDPLRAADMLRESPGMVSAHSGERARRKIHDALDALGGSSSPCGSAVWFIVGCEFSIHEWARREGWNGCPLRHEIAKGILVGGLGVLAVHFGT